MEISFYYKKKREVQIEQGDIFSNLPFFNINSNIVRFLDPNETDYDRKEINLNEYEPAGDGIIKNVVANLLFKPGIVITQNCDALRSTYISFCEIKKFDDPHYFERNTELKKIDFLMQKYEHKEKYFYLPEKVEIFEDKMAVDFSRIFQIERVVLEKMIDKRLCSLGKIPLEHFREKITNYLKRFAYDRWYVLNKDEYNEYYKSNRKKIGSAELDRIKKYPWQQ